MNIFSLPLLQYLHEHDEMYYGKVAEFRDVIGFMALLHSKHRAPSVRLSWPFSSSADVCVSAPVAACSFESTLPLLCFKLFDARHLDDERVESLLWG
jgi:hypothetical protein